MQRQRPFGPELPYLEAFHTVCIEGGFTAAARRLGCTQPAISYQIRSLERVLRAKLVERGGRRVLLTPAGERLCAFCRDTFGELAELRSECAGERREPLRLGSASGFGRYVLFPALRRLRQDSASPPLELQLEFDSAQVVLGRLEQGAYEAAFVYTRRISNYLRYRSVFEEELVLIAPRGFGRGRKDTGLDRVSAFEALPFVTYQEGEYVFGRWFDANFGEPPSRITSVARFSELEEVVDFVRRGEGLSIVPRDSVEAPVASGEVRVVYAGRGEPCFNQVYMVVRSGSSVRRELRQLTDILRGRATTDRET